LVILTVGNKFGAAQEVHKTLSDAGNNVGLVNIRCLKPLNHEVLLPVLEKVKRAIVIEEAVKDGGLGSDIIALAMENKCNTEMLRIGLPCVFVEPGSNEELCEKYALDAKGIEGQIRNHWPELK